MQLYSIMSLDLAHIDEICEDIKNQVESGVCSMALFMFKLVPEGVPFIDKAAITCKNYIVFRDRLKEMGIECGILVQCTIGHGYPLNQKPDIQMYTSLTDGEELYVACPTDEKFKQYIYDQMVTIAKAEPAHIMVDDDLRLIQRPQKGCACPEHLRLFKEVICFFRYILNIICKIILREVRESNHHCIIFFILHIQMIHNNFVGTI